RAVPEARDDPQGVRGNARGASAALAAAFAGGGGMAGLERSRRRPLPRAAPGVPGGRGGWGDGEGRAGGGRVLSESGPQGAGDLMAAHGHILQEAGARADAGSRPNVAKLEARDISKTFRADGAGAVSVLQDLTLRVESGEFLTIIGPSG